MVPPLLEKDGWQLKIPVSFFATGQVIMMIMSILMPGFGVSHKYDHVMPLGFIVAEGYRFGPVNMMVFIISIIAGNLMYIYFRFGLDFIPDIKPAQIRNFTVYFYLAWFFGVALFIMPPASIKLGAYKYGVHEVFGHFYMLFSVGWMLYFSQWVESPRGHAAIGIGCGISLLGQLTGLIQIILNNQKHSGKFQMLGCAVMLGTQLMLTFAAELDRFAIFNAAGFAGSSKGGVYKKAESTGAGGDNSETGDYDSL